MTDRHNFDIKIIDIEFHTPYIEGTYRKIRRLAAERHSGETPHDSATAFAAKLELAVVF